MRKVLTPILFSLSILVPGMTCAEVFQFDDNGDQKIDRIIELDENGRIQKHLNDSNYDGHYDSQVNWNSKTGITSHLIDQDHDQNWDTLRELKTTGEMIEVKVFRLSKMTKSLISTTLSLNIQTKPCTVEEYETLLDDVGLFLKNFSPVARKLDDSPFYEVEKGIQVHNSCVQNFSKSSISKIMGEAISEGLSCLEDLAKEDIEASFKSKLPELIDLFKVQFSGKAKPITLLCDQKKNLGKCCRPCLFNSRA